MKAVKNLLGKKVIIRADRAGVFFGTLNEIEPLGDKLQVELTNLRRLWYWAGAASLTQLAVEGSKKPSDCKFSVTMQSAVIQGVIEVLPCSECAVKSIENVISWKR